MPTKPMRDDHVVPSGAFDPLAAMRLMLLIRRFEEQCLELSRDGEIAGSVHVCLGQEAVPAGAAQVLTADDRVVATYRGHGWALACGVPPEEVLAEICQRATGTNGGRAGSPYLSAPEHGFVGENSIVGAGAPIGAGLALAAIAQQRSGVVLVSLGDGAMNQGATHEALAFSAARDLPVVLVCENNGWSEMTPTTSMFRVADIAERAAGYGIPGRVVDGNDPEAVHAALHRAVVDARAGGGPVVVECKTARLSGHYNRDIEHYRPKEDIEAAAAADPVARQRAGLATAGSTDAELDALDEEARRVVVAATQAVLGASAPAPEPESLDVTSVPAPSRGLVPARGDGEEMTYVKAVTAALDAELAARPEVLVYGEDVGHAGGIFGASRGLQQRYGAQRVFDTPIAESAILGSALGAAMEGMRPVVEIMWADFLLVALDQLVNQAANLRYLSRSRVTAPLVVRTQQGATPGSCAQHSQCLEALLTHIPGLKVGVPATAADAYSMLRAAIADPDPCILFESRALYQTKGAVDLGAAEDVGGARLHREGADVVVLTWGTMLAESLRAAEELASEGVETAVLDLRWLSPLDEGAIDALVERSSGRVLVAHEANRKGGFGAEVAARVNERHFDLLDAPVARVAAPDARMPSAPSLQAGVVPDAARITVAARRLLQESGWAAQPS